MDISAVSTLANSNNTSAVADKLKNNVKNLSFCGAGHKGNEGFHDTKE